MKHRKIKRNFTAGELSPLLDAAITNKKYINGCRSAVNMLVLAQGPIRNRAGTQFIYDLTSLSPDMSVRPRYIPFIFSKTQAYALILFKHTSGKVRMVLGVDEGLIEDPSSPGNPYTFEFTLSIDLAELTYAQSADILYLAQPDQPIIELIRSSSTSWSANVMAITDQPSDWNSTDGYPQFVDFYEQRMVAAATKARPQTIWFSKAGNYYDHGVSSPQIASDACVFTLDSGRQGPIVWTASATKLMIGTLGDEWIVSGSGYEPLSFTSILARKQTNDGGRKLRPLMIGPATLFIQRHGKTVYQYVYDFNRDSYTTIDLSVLAPHLTEDSTIVDWAYQQVPNGIVWAVRADGEMLGLTFKREHNVSGWHRHNTDGKFLSCTCIPGQLEDELWVLVEREIDGVSKWYVEKKAPESTSSDHTKHKHVDCFSEYAHTDEITDLLYLEGKEVVIVTDGAIHPSRTVSNGKITLNKTYNYILVGLKYVPEVRPLPEHTKLEDGTTEGAHIVVKRAQLDIYRSLGFYYGRTTERGEIMEMGKFRNISHPTGKAIPLFSGYKTVSFPEGWSDDADLIVRQEWPYPLIIRRIIAYARLSE